MNRTVRIGLAILVAVVIAAGGFFGGMAYGKGQATTTTTASARPANMPGQPLAGTPQAGQGGMLAGEIQTIDGNGFTLTDSSGKTVQVNVTGTTLIQKQTSVSLSDLQQGDTVMVSGTQASDGSVTARSVQVGQAGAFGGPAEANPPSGALPGSSQGAGNQSGTTNP